MTRRAPRAAPIVLPALCAVCRAQLAAYRAAEPERRRWSRYCRDRHTLAVVYADGRTELHGGVTEDDALRMIRSMVYAAGEIGVRHGQPSPSASLRH